MSGVWYQPENPAFFTAAGGEATLGQIYQAARDQALFVDNTFAAEAAMEEAYQRRNARIFELTGESLDNPYRVTFAASNATRRESWLALPQSYPEIRRRQVETWKGSVRDLAARRPELAGQLMPASSMEEAALDVTREAEERFTRLAGSRDGAAKYLALFAGGGWGALRDPVQVATLAVGGGPGGARTVMGRILTTAFSEAAVNAGVELALQPIVQSYRAKAGLESGIDVALQNAAFAGLFGAVLGGGARALGEALMLGGRSADRALSVADTPPALRAEIEANLPEAVASVREAMTPPQRGALDQVEMIGHLDTSRPATALPEHHDMTVTAAHRAADALGDAEAELPAMKPDPVQISRIAEEMLPAPAQPQRQGQSLVEFLQARGGLIDDAGELQAIGAETLARKPKGKAGDRRQQLDRAREAAEEAGYIGRAGETQVTTVADLLDAIDRELRGDKIYPRGADEGVGSGLAADFEAERARIESRVAEVVAHAGPAVDDRIIREAAELSLTEGIDAFDALESVLIRTEPAAPAVGRIDTPLPGWSDEELMAASAGRSEPFAENGSPFDDPGHAGDEFMLDATDIDVPEDFMMPGEDGAPVTLAKYMQDLANDQELHSLVKACRA